MFTALLMQFFRSDNKKSILGKLWIPLSVLAVVVLSLLPKIGYSLTYGANTLTGKRSFPESEHYALKIINLLLSPTYSRFGFLRRYTETYPASSPPLVNENQWAGLGLIGALGFVALCIAFFRSFCRKSESGAKEQTLVDFLCLGTLVFLLTASVGGFGEIFNRAVTAQIRCYNRCSIMQTGSVGTTIRG